MKFLVDNQLPAALARFIQKRGFDCQHVLDVGLSEASDIDIYQYAVREERVIISKDQDFHYLANHPELGIKLIWVRLGNCRTPALIQTFEQFWSQIEACLRAGDRIIEIR